MAAERFGGAARRVVAVLLVAMLVANTLNIAADLLAVGEGMHLLRAGPVVVWTLVAGAASVLLVATGSFARMAKLFKVLAACLLVYLVVPFFADRGVAR